MADFDRFSSSASSPQSLSPSPSPSAREGGGGAIAEDTLFVAVSREFKDSKSVLLWALQNRGDSEICVVHVHQPDKLIPTAMGKLPVNLANKNQTEAHRVNEREKLSKKLEKHLQFCHQHGVKAAKIYVEMDSIQDGIVKLITDKGIGKLVMGAAADRRYTKNMIEILSEKAKYVRQHAPGYCHIWFICKKLLIHTREATEKSGSFEGIGRLRPAPSYEIGGLLEARSSFDEYEMPTLIRSLSRSSYRSSLSGPSAPDLTPSQLVTDEQNEIEAWLLTQHMQKPCDLNPSSLSPSLEELENVKNQKYKVLEELQVALDHISSFESRIEKSNLLVEQLERRLESATETVEKYKKERDEMQMERDNAIKQVEEEGKQLKEGATRVDLHMLSFKLPFQDIEKATNQFDQSLKVGEDAYGITYKGFINLEVVVKIPHPSSPSTPQQFQQEVEIMHNLRHLNIVNLIGNCPESQALIYEYCANGNLEDQLKCNVEGSPLKWQTRIRIATELCIVLMFLHSHKPQPIIHGDLRAENVHLDSQLTCKLNDFRTSIAILNGTFSLENTARLLRTDSRPISYANIDPEYFASGELTTRSDVYSFGIILMRLLTGKPAMKLIRQVQSAVGLDELSALLDPSAGWPLEQAKLLADLALRCCEMTRDRRPDLEPDVWKVMESMKEFCD